MDIMIKVYMMFLFSNKERLELWVRRLIVKIRGIEKK